ncbi:MAG TPA: GNAT family N-acetyltransferase [Thermoanaerobaculia bacterium]|nr:GNAT family N-acetyltransferase [Thermoanaerobaculia bacterium]
MFQLETKRLIIRSWQPGDRAAFTAMARDPEVMRYVHGGKPYTEEEIDAFLARQAKQLADFGVCMGPMVEKSSGRIVGLAGTQPLGRTGDFEIGWWLARDAWGRGFATEAGGAAMQHVFEALDKPRAVAIIDVGNAASVAVAKRLGMEYDRRYTGAELTHRLSDIVVDLFYRNRTPSS